MSLHRGWSLEWNDLAPASMAWQATHPDYEDPAYDDGRPLVLTGCDERECQIAVDDFLFELGEDEPTPSEISALLWRLKEVDLPMVPHGADQRAELFDRIDRAISALHRMDAAA